MFCRKCGEQLPDDAKFCGKCGTKVELPSLNDKDESVKSKKEKNKKLI